MLMCVFVCFMSEQMKVCVGGVNPQPKLYIKSDFFYKFNFFKYQQLVATFILQKILLNSLLFNFFVCCLIRWMIVAFIFWCCRGIIYFWSYAKVNNRPEIPTARATSDNCELNESGLWCVHSPSHLQMQFIIISIKCNIMFTFFLSICCCLLALHCSLSFVLLWDALRIHCSWEQ